MKKYVYGIYTGVKRFFWTAFVKFKCASYGEKLRVNHKSCVTSQTYLGNHVNMNGMQISGMGEVRIGNYFHSGVECMIITQNHNYDEGTEIPYDSTYICKSVIIEDNVWLGNRVLILPGVHIGEGAIIQAGSVVVKDVPSCGIAGGNPAVVFRERNRQHYDELKKQGKFH